MCKDIVPGFIFLFAAVTKIPPVSSLPGWWEDYCWGITFKSIYYVCGADGRIDRLCLHNFNY